MLSAGMACRHALTGRPCASSCSAAAVIVDQDRDVGDPGGPLAAAGHAGDARRGLRGGAGAAARAGALVALCHRAARLWRGDGGGRAAAGQRLGAGAARRAGHAGSEPGKARGFSGEGAVLHLVAGGDANEDAAFVSTLLAFEPRIDIAQLAARPVARRADRVRAGRAGVFRPGGVRSGGGRVLPSPAAGAGGAAGYVASPVGRGAQAGGRRRGAARRRGQYTVQSAQQRYRIALGAEPAQDRCTCPWHAKYQGTRGPCKHTLAVRMFLDPLNAPGAGA